MLPPVLQSWLEACWGAVETCADLSTGHGDSTVLRVAGPAGTAICKIFAHGRKFQQERAAYEHWFAQLPQTAPLLAVHAYQPTALLLCVLPGTPLAEQTASASELNQACAHAGRWLAQLHALPYADDDPLPLAAAYRQRAEATLARGGEVLTAREHARLSAALPLFDQLGAAPRVPCHRDFTPRNWLRAANAELSFIDGEHARADWWLSDVLRLQNWPTTSAASMAAFWRGYGRSPSCDQQQVLHLLLALEAVATITWATAHNDNAFRTQGEKALQRWLPQAA